MEVMQTVLFVLFGLGAAGGALAVVISQNVVRMAFYLIISLGSTAGLFFILGADFVGATQLLIYVGGTVVLLIFGVMLTASGPYVTIKTSSGELTKAAMVGGAFFFMLVFTVLRLNWDDNALKLEGTYGETPAIHETQRSSVRSMAGAFLGTRFDPPAPGETEPRTGYLLPFEIISMHLLVVLVGAAYLARAKRKVVKVEDS